VVAKVGGLGAVGEGVASGKDGGGNDRGKCLDGVNGGWGVGWVGIPLKENPGSWPLYTLEGFGEWRSLSQALRNEIYSKLRPPREGSAQFGSSGRDETREVERATETTCTFISLGPSTSVHHPLSGHHLHPLELAWSSSSTVRRPGICGPGPGLFSQLLLPMNGQAQQICSSCSGM
jgi:hypothetical protein